LRFLFALIAGKGRDMTYDFSASPNETAALSDCLDRDLDGDPTALVAAPDPVKRVFYGQNARSWLANGPKTVFQVACETFCPDLYAVIVTETDAAGLLANDDCKNVLVLLVDAVRAARDGKETACIVYADTPPHGRSPNTPAAILSSGMTKDKYELLCKTVSLHAGVAAEFADFRDGRGVYMVAARFPVSIARPNVQNLGSHTSIWDLISQKYGHKPSEATGN
jgi:hypothetical protein